MGAEPYWYFVKYEQDLNGALQKLRLREYNAGRYNPVIPLLDFPVELNSSAPGAQHSSIEAAIDDAMEDGTRSILDIVGISEKPDFCVAAPISTDTLIKLYNTIEPTREMIESNMDFFEDIMRGHCIYVIIYKDNKPDEILFAGYSFD